MTHRYRFEDVLIDAESFRLSKAGNPLQVEPKALNLLIFMVENRGRLVGRREILDAVWKDAFVSDHVLNRAVGQLRKVLEDDAKEPRYIETVPTLGYRFIAEVQVEDLNPSQTSGVLSVLDTPVHPAQEEASPATVSARALLLPEEEPRSMASRGSGRLSSRSLAIGVGIALVLVAGVSVLWIVSKGRSDAGAIRSLAVLPLENLSGDPAQQYLADGMTDELITNLGQLSALRVISQTTAMQYKNAHKTLPQIARELQVDAVIEGSVLRSGDRLRIEAQLVAAPTDKQLWARRFEGDLKDVLDLQNQVAGAVVDQIRVELTTPEQMRLAMRHEVNPQAYEALLKGYFFDQNTEETERKSLGYFRQAVDLDPGFARAYVGIAGVYNFLGDWDNSPDKYGPTGGVSVGEATAAADAAIAKAIALDPNLAGAYVERGWTSMFYHLDFPGAERDFRHALELDPGSSTAHEGYGDYLIATGHFDEALQQMRRARDLDPLSILVLTDYCSGLWYARRYDEALTQCQAALELNPNFEWALRVETDVYFSQRKFTEANATIAKLGRGDAASLAMLDEVHGEPGLAGAFESYEKKEKLSSDVFFVAMQYAGLGRRDEAFALLEKAYERRSDVSRLVYAGVDPHFDSLRSDPRFDSFLLRAGLPPQPPALRNAALRNPVSRSN